VLRTKEAAEATTDGSIRDLEQRLRLAFPAAYREFLLMSNGGRPERDLVFVPNCAASPYARVHFFFGVGDAVESCDLEWNIGTRDDLPEGLVPIATTEGADIFCLTSGGGVVFVDGYEKAIYPIADSFGEFVQRLYRDETSPDFSDERRFE
jgi:hypothetical protein